MLETTPSLTFVVITATSEGNDLVFAVLIIVFATVTAELTTEIILLLLLLVVVGGLGGGPFGRRGGSGGGPDCTVKDCSIFFRLGGFSTGGEEVTEEAHSGAKTMLPVVVVAMQAASVILSLEAFLLSSN